jgi:FkbM family methyltransferase
MSLPGWFQDRVIYPRARAAILSLFNGADFYGPASAMARYQWRVPEPVDVRRLRQEDGLAIWQTPAGELATAETEIAGHLSNLLGEFDRNEYLGPPLRLRSGAVVLDVGANIGLFTLQALRAGVSKVISLEPNPASRSALVRNTRFAEGRVTVLPKGAWHSAGTMTMTVDPYRPGRSSVVVPSPERASYEIPVELESLDAIVKDLALAHVDFIKMDIEGAETHALRGAAGILARFKPQLSVAVEHTSDRLANAEQVRRTVLELNPEYRCVAGPYTITPERKLAPDILYFH